MIVLQYIILTFPFKNLHRKVPNNPTVLSEANANYMFPDRLSRAHFLLIFDKAEDKIGIYSESEATNIEN